MKRRRSALLAAGGAAALTLALGTQPTLATAIHSSYTAVPGGVVTATSTMVQLIEIKVPQGKTWYCKSSTISITLPGDRVPHAGSGFGTITALSLAQCGLGTQYVDFTATTNFLPWAWNISSFDTVHDAADGSITGIDIVLSRPNPLCSFTIDGTGPGAHNGYVMYTYSNKTNEITISKTGGNLVAYNVEGCAGALASGEGMAISGVYTVSPPQDIT
jgi:hypothetical protein